MAVDAFYTAGMGHLCVHFGGDLVRHAAITRPSTQHVHVIAKLAQLKQDRRSFGLQVVNASRVRVNHLSQFLVRVLRAVGNGAYAG